MFKVSPTLSLVLINTVMVWLYFTDQLRLYIHPRYMTLFLVMNGISLVVGIFLLLRRSTRYKYLHLTYKNTLSILPLIVIIISLIIPNKPILMSQTVDSKTLQTLSINTKKYASCRTVVRNSQPIAIEQWRTYVDNCPDVKKYVGEKVDIIAFVYESENVSGKANTFTVARLVMACCIVDATPVRFDVVSAKQTSELQQDDWVAVKGRLALAEDGKTVIIAAETVTKIKEPRQPYGYY